MKHLCVDARLYSAAGIGTLLKAELTRLHRVYALTLLCKEEEKAILRSFSTRLISIEGEIYSLREQFEFARKIPKCDLFWSPHFNIPLFPIRAHKRLTTICDVYHLAHFSTLSLSQKFYAKLLYNAAFYLSDRVTTISEFSQKEIMKFATLKPKHLEVVVPPFDYCPPPSSKPPKRDFLLFVGNIKPHKNLVRLVHAYAQLKPKEPLFIVGKKEGFITPDDQLLQEVEENPFLRQNVHFTGYLSDEALKELYANAKLFIFPSTYEGFGYPPLEAMACGCPVVAARAGSIPEVCQDAVEYVNPFSIDAIAAGMQRLLSDEKRREELVRKGEELVNRKREQKNLMVDLIGACCSSS